MKENDFLKLYIKTNILDYENCLMIKLLNKLIFVIILFLIIHIILYNKNILISTLKNGKKKIGVLGMKHSNNIGNNLVKFAMSILLKNYGFEPIMISLYKNKSNLYFLKKYVKFKIIKDSFSEIKKKDYDILMVNSDQTWNKYKFFLDIGFLKFAEKWNIPKFVYGASLGHDFWQFSKKFDKQAKKLLKKFTGISVRENGAVDLVKKHLGIKPLLVLDPTLLINKNYYLELIKNFKKNNKLNNKYICVYQLDKNNIISDFIIYASTKLNYQIYNIKAYGNNYIENFIYGFNICKAIITDSFHGTVFSIIFNKPFISFINSKRGRGRFFSLNEIFNIKDRIVFPNNNTKININLLTIPLNINKEKINILKKVSLNFLKKNLGIIK